MGFAGMVSIPNKKILYITRPCESFKEVAEQGANLSYHYGFAFYANTKKTNCPARFTK